MEDISLIIIKPEIIDRFSDIKKSLRKRGYKIIFQKKYNSWRKIAKKLYSEFSSEEIKTYIVGYDKHKFDDKFIMLIVTCEKGNTVEKLNKDKGNFIDYQSKNINTLRAEFGLPKRYNLQHGNISFTYCGFHCPQNQEELIRDLNILHLKNKFI